MDDDFKYKYQKYKIKYNLLKQSGGQGNIKDFNISPMIVKDYGEKCNEQVKKHLLLSQVLSFEEIYAISQNFDMVKKIYDKECFIRMANQPGTIGIENNIKEMMKMYNMAPDTRIIEHGVQFGSGQWIVVEQIMTGTFKNNINENCNATNKKFTMKSCSFIRWENEKIIEEINFWDNDLFMKQIGVKNKKCIGFVTDVKYSLNDKVGFTSYGRTNESDEMVRKRLILFEGFNFNGYNKRNWQLAYDLYDPSAFIIFHNGSKVEGIENILQQMKNGMNDDKVISIPIHFGSGDWTAASMLMTGTINMPGSAYNGQTWTMEHCVLIRWHEYKIVEAHAYWDNAEFEIQTGIVLKL